MGLQINRRDGESITLDMIDGRRLTLTRDGLSLVCREASSPDGHAVIAWKRRIEPKTVVGVDRDVTIECDSATVGVSVSFIVEAPASVTISRSEEMRTVDDRIREASA